MNCEQTALETGRNMTGNGVANTGVSENDPESMQVGDDGGGQRVDPEIVNDAPAPKAGVPRVLRFYTVDKIIGQGNFAKVYKGTHSITKDVVAIKAIDKDDLGKNKASAKENMLKIRREVEVLKNVVHRNIIRLYQVIEDEQFIYLVTEYANGGEIFDFIVARGRLHEAEGRKKFHQIALAVDYLHDKGIVHRDIKAENLLLDDQFNVKLADFGFTNWFSTEKKLNSWCGSPPYAAPELFSGTPYTGPEVDIWSLGVVLYVLVSGVLPFEGSTIPALKERVLKATFRIPFFLSDQCENLVRRMLSKDPKKRPSIKEVLGHVWMKPVAHTYSDDMADFDGSSGSNGTSSRQRWNPFVIEHMTNECGVVKEKLLESLENERFDDHAGMYFILHDRLRLRSQNKENESDESKQRVQPQKQPLTRKNAIAGQPMVPALSGAQLPPQLTLVQPIPAHAHQQLHALRQQHQHHAHLQQQQAQQQQPRNGLLMTLSSPAAQVATTAAATHLPLGRNISAELATQNNARLQAYLGQRRHTVAPQGIQEALAAGGGLQSLGGFTAPPVLTARLGTAHPVVTAAPAPHISNIPSALLTHPTVRQRLSGGAPPPPPGTYRQRVDRRRSDTHAIQSFVMSQQQQQQQQRDHGSGQLRVTTGSTNDQQHHIGSDHSNLSLISGLDNLHVTRDNEHAYMPSTASNRHHPPALFLGNPTHRFGLSTIKSPSPEDSVGDSSNNHVPLNATGSVPVGQAAFGMGRHEVANRLASAPDRNLGSGSSSNHGGLDFAQQASALGAYSTMVQPQPEIVSRAMPGHQLRRNSLDPRVGVNSPHMAVANAAGGHFARMPRMGRRGSHALASGVAATAPAHGHQGDPTGRWAALSSVAAAAAAAPPAATPVTSAAEDDASPVQDADDCQSPREARFPLSADQATTLPLPRLKQEIQRVLEINSRVLSYECSDCTYSVTTFDEDMKAIRFEIEICQITGLKVYGLRLKRIVGDQWGYKRFSKALMAAMQLG